MDKLTKTELLGMLKFGSDSVFASEGEIDDRDVDAILLGATTKVMTDEAVERDAPSVLAASKLDCASFDTNITEMSKLTEFNGQQLKQHGYRSIADGWKNMQGARARQSTTVKIGRDNVLRSNNYSWDSDLGRAKESRDIRQYNVSEMSAPSHDASSWHAHMRTCLHVLTSSLL
jgi:hypothetical protein